MPDKAKAKAAKKPAKQFKGTIKLDVRDSTFDWSAFLFLGGGYFRRSPAALYHLTRATGRTQLARARTRGTYQRLLPAPRILRPELAISGPPRLEIGPGVR
jgi:hypothetical protein